jgi:hypothetical protein
MKGRLNGTSSLMVIGLLLAPAAQAAEAEIGAVIQEEYSGATGIRVGGQQGELRFQQPVHADEKVVTHADAVTQLQFLDESTLYVGTNSVVTLDKFVYDPASQLGEAALHFTKGAFRFVSGEMKNEEAITLRTRNATLVIRGTTITLYLLDDGSDVVDVDGDVQALTCPNGNTPPTDIASGTAIKIDYMCDVVLGYALGPGTGPPKFEGFRPIGGGLGGQDNTNRGVSAGEIGEDRPKPRRVVSSPVSDSDSDGSSDSGGSDDDGEGGV